MPTQAPKVGDYVTDRSDSGRYDRGVYCITGFSFDRAIVRYVGPLRNGRIEYARNQPVTHRTTANLVVWN